MWDSAQISTHDPQTVIKACREGYHHLGYDNEAEFQEDVRAALPIILRGMGRAPVSKIEEEKDIYVDTPEDNGARSKIDLLVYHENGTGSIVEVKCSDKRRQWKNPKGQASGVGQLMLYQQVLHNKREAEVPMYLVDTRVHLQSMQMCDRLDLPITLIQFRPPEVLCPRVIEWSKN